MNPRDSFTAMNKYRLAFLCILHGSETETPDGVPAERRAAFEADVEYHNQTMEKAFDEIGRNFGASGGFFENIPAELRATAARELEYQAALYVIACRYELELKRIEKAESLEQAFDQSMDWLG
jgi:hypothetical protein